MWYAVNVVQCGLGPSYFQVFTHHYSVPFQRFQPAKRPPPDPVSRGNKKSKFGGFPMESEFPSTWIANRVESLDKQRQTNDKQQDSNGRTAKQVDA